jgi:hypothetical protein
VGKWGGVNDKNIWLPHAMYVRKYKPEVKTLFLPNGEKVKVTISETRTVKQIEHNDSLDAVVRPKTVALKIRRMT